MSDENKDFGDKAEDAFEKAKESAKEFSEDAKESAKEFSDSAKRAYENSNIDSGKNVAIIAHITFIGWIVALIMNNGKKTELGSYYIRQTLGIWIITLVLSWIPIVGCFAFIICLVLVIMSLINAINEKEVPTPVLGEYFQDWFKSL
ncbi:MAG: heat shock 9/12 family protein [Maribacter sp.]|nr:heat shock 9/12 family protein [Maribacter sp.]